MSILKITKPTTLFWTNHAKAKMRFYRLSEQRIRRVLNSPKRIEEGVAPKTVAMMQPPTVKWKMTNGKKEKEIWSQEIWVMVQDTKTKRKVISAWRYPGMTKSDRPLPQQILNEIEEAANAEVDGVDPVRK